MEIYLYLSLSHVETLSLLSKLNVDKHIDVEIKLDELDLTSAESKATYEQIKEYILKKFGFKVSMLYIAQIKRRCGIPEISKAWSGMTTREYKYFKGLKKQNLRDNMSTTERILNMLAETATKDITESSNPQGLEENKKAAKRGGNVVKVARETLEKETGEPVITPKNAIDFGRLISDVAKDLPKKADELEADE